MYLGASRDHKIKITYSKLSNDLVQIAGQNVSGQNVQQGHQELSGRSNENKSLKSNQLVPSIYIMIELCFFSLDQ